MKGYQFLRQKPIKNYIVDFYCSKLKLIIEIDGDSHIGKEEADLFRQKEIESQGVMFLRFNDLDVKKNIGGVLTAIEKWIDEAEKTIPLTPFQKGD
jgi:very-short-patch-repair endonuclease